MPGKSEQSSANVSAEVDLPVLNTDALSNLTQAIDSKLREKDSGPPRKKVSPKLRKKERSKPETANSEKGFKGGPTPGSANVTESKDKTSVKPKSKPKLPSAAKPIQGQKRLRDGEVKESAHQNPSNGVNGIKLGNKKEASTSNVDIDFANDIKALGGTEDDIDLIGDAQSDSEIEGEGNGKNDAIDGDLGKELQQLARQLGVDKLGQKEQAYDTEEELDEKEVHDDDDRPQKALASDSTGLSQQTNGINPEAPISRKGEKTHASLAFQSLSEWHVADLPTIPNASGEYNSLPHDLLQRIHAHAKSLLEKDNQEYAAHDRNASSAQRFYSTIMSTGTLSDKISALTLSVQESPVHNMKPLENLVGLARKRSRGQAVEVLGALKDLFGPGNLLPSDRKLRVFAAQPGLSAAFEPTDFQWTSSNPLPKNLRESHLISWAYEDWLKAIFFEVLKIMETWSNDEVPFARGKAVDYLCQLLKEKPEQEANLLRLLVNKLGDSDNKIASKTSFNILQLETTHPLMKPTIISAIESDILFRPGQSLHAKYYATITLNQTVLSGKEEGVAKKLLDIYFGLFVMLLQKPEPAKMEVQRITINKKGELQGGGAAGGKKAQKKQAEKEKATTAHDDLREKMLSAVLTGVNRATPFNSTNDETFEKHLDTLFRVTHSSNFNTSIQALMLIQQLNGSHQGSVDRFYRTLYESLLDPRLLTSSKQALYLNLLFRAIRADLNIKRVKAFAKRLLQVVSMHQPSFTCGTLYLLRELESVFANLEAFVDQPEEDDEEEEENFKDVEEPSANGDNPPILKSQSQPLHATQQPPKLQQSNKYDGRKRDPEHSNAAHSTLWELTPFLYHYHPSVSLFATRLSTHAPMPPKPDLALNTLIHFLDRFVYRNPKAAPTTKGSSIMQPMVGGDSSALLLSKYSGKDRVRQPVNDESFWRKGVDSVGADEVFFHRYFSKLGKGRDKAKEKKEKKAKKKKDENGEESESEGDEDEVWKALVESRPELDDGGSDGGIFSDDEDLGSALNDLDDEDGDEGVIINEDSDIELEDGNGVPVMDQDDDDLNLEDGDDDALLGSDDEVPSDLDDAFAAEAQNIQSSGKNRKRAVGKEEQLGKGGEKGETRGQKRRRLKNLPTFASADDYAKILGGSDHDEEGIQT